MNNGILSFPCWTLSVLLISASATVVIALTPLKELGATALAATKGSNKDPFAVSKPEPRGVRLKRVDTGETILFKWGATANEFVDNFVKPPVDRYGDLICLGLRKANADLPKGVAVCREISGREKYKWHVDFGTKSFRVGNIKFLHRRFFEYDFEFSSHNFAFIEQSIKGALGKPTGRLRKTVQNRMGASFERQFVVWKGRHTTVSLWERGPGRVDLGTMRVTLDAVSRQIPDVKAGEAPF